MKAIPKTKCATCHGSGQTLDHSAIGLTLRARREAISLSMRYVAKSIKVSPMFLSDLERGRRNWTLARIKEYENALDPLKADDPVVNRIRNRARAEIEAYEKNRKVSRTLSPSR
jgi:transcriptional regulator with XRE-family HTH domain